MLARSNGIFAALLLCAAINATPVQAASTYASPEQSAGTGDDTIARIQEAFDDQRYVDAGKLLDQALVTSGNDTRLVYWAGELNLALGRYQDALGNFKKASNDTRVADLAQEGEGITLSLLGRGDEALVPLKAAVVKRPEAWHAWNALAAEFDRRHDWTQAEDAYGHALSASGEAAIVLNNRGFSRLAQQQLDGAIQDFVSALQKKPDLAAARNNLRLAMALKGEYDRAVTGANAKDLAAVLNNAGYAALVRGDYDQAKDLLNKAVKAKGEYYPLAAENLQLVQNLTAAPVGNQGNDSH